MRSLFCSACPILLFVLLSVSADNFHIDVFVDVIMSIRKFYSAASVIFTHPGDKYGDYGDLQITHLVHTSTRLLNRRSVMTADFNFNMLWRTIKYKRQIVQPIFIVIIPNFEAYLEFVEVTKTYPMSFPVWFTLFLYTPSNDTHDHCREPIGNPLNLAFDTQMLVLCHNEGILQEWYSVKGETVKIFDLAEWDNEQTRFVLLTNLSLYDRRNDMEGIVLRGVTVKFAGNYVATMYGKVLEELTYSLNFTLNIVSKMDDHGLWDYETRTWTGVMGEIVSGHADFAVADMSMTSFRVRHVDFTLPLIISKISLYIKEPAVCGVKWLGYFQTFNLCTWATIITLIALAPLLLSFMKTYRESRNTVDVISETFICIWGIFCQQALIEFPKKTSLRVAYLTIFLTAVLVTAHYSAALVCFLTACTRVLPFQTMDEFIDAGSHKLIVPRGSADYDVLSFQAKYESSTKVYSVKLMELMKDERELPSDLIDGFVQVCTEKKVAFMVLSALKKSVELKIPCKLSSISTERIDNLGMILTKGSPYTAVINYHLQKFLDNGIMTRLRDTRFLPKAAEEKTYMPVRLVNVVPILSILCGGIIISTTVLVIEKIHYRSKKRKFQSIAYPSKKLLIKKYNN
ncbi:glutamate receptor 3-like isoform X2 [Cardiocondyla obscurior]|uniref:glutamate receptor 3-like isoform X2 n=1 Tax=Cardiocondyla obscurior TaxID=286306 RepID=UPI00396563DF